MQRLFFVRFLFFCFLLVWLLASCVYPFGHEKYFYHVDIPESVRIGFEGKGAAAGVMMSSSMGPMGIAIGVAIDEGIAKDIREALGRADCNLHDVISKSFQEAARVHAATVIPLAYGSERSADMLVHLDQVKFRTLPSEQDLTTAAVVLTIDKAGVMHELVSDPAEAGSGVPLSELRSDGGKGCVLLHAEVTRLFDEWYRSQ